MNFQTDDIFQNKQDKQTSRDFFCAKLYKKREGFDVDVSMSLGKGSMNVIVGHSGSGKSTVLRLIAGLEMPDSKDAVLTLDGQNILRTPPGKRGIGMVFQEPSLFMHKNVISNVAYGLLAHNIKKSIAYHYANKYICQFGLEGFAQRMPETLSGGEVQRVALARTLIVEPQLVLFDEPLSSLDAPLRQKLAEDIMALQQKIGFTGIWVTHDEAEARRIASTIFTIERGRIIKTENLK